MLTSHVVLDFITMGLDTYNTSQDGRFDVSVSFAGTLNSALNNYTSDHPVLPLGQLYGPPASCISLGFVQLDPNMFNLLSITFRCSCFLDGYALLINITRRRFALIVQNRLSRMPVRSWVPMKNELDAF